ncbi:uncharacterized protein LOC118743566 [Rhagoletis pomonella]|uniref:uncharacterized protein LOC118743566 n=1 Tax=Rhagoletis pomonella TaxID=28610 RepID=UPI001781FEAC|nr:uncharacterized protein LOC118743566 [Rhagoletis pomonella]
MENIPATTSPHETAHSETITTATPQSAIPQEIPIDEADKIGHTTTIGLETPTAGTAGLPIRPYNRSRARILIGLDNAKVGVPIEIRENKDSNLIAAKCRLGWSIYGRGTIDCTEQSRVLHTCECSPSAEDRMDQQMKAFFSIDSTGVYAPTKPLLCKDDERAIKLMENSTRFCAAEKRWETGLLWKHDVVELPDSLPMAIRRLSCLESKIERDPSTSRFLIDIIQDYERKGLVWDAAAKVSGIGLNDMLLKGPDLLKSLLGILLRFRERPFAVCGDIREMFHQIRIIKEDQTAQKFLWRNGDRSRDYDVYVMNVMTFGASCSPSLANYVKNRNAERFADHHRDAVHAIVENTFVDDWLQSADTEDELATLATTVHWIHQEGGFQMRNWVSYSKGVLASLHAEHAADAKCFEEPEAVIEKRQILRTIMTIFDPLGLLGFAIIQAKIILQDVWRSGVGWDQPVKEEQRNNWFKWVRRIPSINGIRIPRCFSLAFKSKINELHIFVDASIKAYAALAYVRSEVDTQICCTLIASKTRVAPLKPISVPRLELLAAVLGLRLANFIESELSIKVSRRTFWTDSKNVLFWLRSDSRKFNQFVALRVGEILEGSVIKEWRWVPSRENIADEGTKWSDNRGFDDNQRWFGGPKFLLEEESSWPVLQFSDADDEAAEDLHHTDFDDTTTMNTSVITPDANRFSCWEKLRTTHRFILRFIRFITKGKQCSKSLEALLGKDDLDSAELAIMINCQGEVFHEEISRLRNDNPISQPV